MSNPTCVEDKSDLCFQLAVSGDTRYVETDSNRTEAIETPCVVFLILGQFVVGGQACSQRYTAYQITDEKDIQMEAYSVVVIIQPSNVPPGPENTVR